MKQQAVHVYVHEFDPESMTIALTAQLHDGTVLANHKSIDLKQIDGKLDLDDFLQQVARKAFDAQLNQILDPLLSEPANLGPVLRSRLL